MGNAVAEQVMKQTGVNARHPSEGGITKDGLEDEALQWGAGDVPDALHAVMADGASDSIWQL